MRHYTLEELKRNEAERALTAARRRATEAEAEYWRDTDSDYYSRRHFEAQRDLSAAERGMNKYR